MHNGGPCPKVTFAAHFSLKFSFGTIRLCCVLKHANFAKVVWFHVQLHRAGNFRLNFVIKKKRMLESSKYCKQTLRTMVIACKSS